MSYATVQNMIDAFSEQEMVDITDKTGSGVIGAAEMLAALESADAEIDSYLAGRYPVPLTPVPRVIMLWACEIARYRLYKSKPLDAVVERYKAAIRSLENVAKGVIKLGAEPPAQTVSVGVDYAAGASVFGGSGLDGL